MFIRIELEMVEVSQYSKCKNQIPTVSQTLQNTNADTNIK